MQETATARALGTIEILELILEAVQDFAGLGSTIWGKRQKDWDSIVFAPRAVCRHWKCVYDDRLVASQVVAGGIHFLNPSLPLLRVVRLSIAERSVIVHTLAFPCVSTRHKELYRGILVACAAGLRSLSLSCDLLRHVAEHYKQDPTLQLPLLHTIEVSSLLFPGRCDHFSAFLASLSSIRAIKTRVAAEAASGLSQNELDILCSFNPAQVERLDLDLYSYNGARMDSAQFHTLFEHFGRLSRFRLRIDRKVQWIRILPQGITHLDLEVPATHIPEILRILADPLRLPALKVVSVKHCCKAQPHGVLALIESAIAGLKCRGTVENLDASAAMLHKLVE